MRLSEIPCPDRIEGLAWVYILQSADGALYVGRTCDVRERLRKHRLGLGSKHTREHGDCRLVFVEGPMPAPLAANRERQLKRWSRAKKEALIRRDAVALQTLSSSRD